MLRVAIIRGNHDSHTVFSNTVTASPNATVVHEVIMDRGGSLPSPPPGLDQHLTDLWNKHFRLRDEAGNKYFSDKVSRPTQTEHSVNFIENEAQLNSVEQSDILIKSRPDVALIFGSGIIREPLLSSLPTYKVNLHLGLIPYYKGVITMFWPQYFLEPTMAGCTYHVITDNIDVGCIIHQVVPELERGDGIHEVAAKSCLTAFSSLEILLDELEHRIKHNIDPIIDPSLEKRGKMFLARDFHASQLKVIYDLYDDDIVDHYLDGKLECRSPNLIQV